MAAGLGFLLAGALVALAVGSSSSSSSGGSGGGAGGGTMTCAQAIQALPTIKAADGGPSLQEIVNAAMLSTVMAGPAYEVIAQQLDRLASDPGTSSTIKQAATIAAGCVRARGAKAGGGGTGGGPIDASKLTCEQAFALLPAALQTEIVAARLAGTPALLTAAADHLDAVAAATSDISVKGTLQMAAACLRAGAGGAGADLGKAGAGAAHVDENGVLSTLSGTAPRTNIASNPAFQWIHTVKAGQNANVITSEIFGSTGTTVTRVDELIRNNPVEQKGRNLGPIRSDWAAGTPGQTPGVLNWTSLRVGDRLRLPKTWNQWISEDGDPRGSDTPFPRA